MTAPAVKRDWVTTTVIGLMLIAGAYVAFESDEPVFGAAWVLMLVVYGVAMACFLPSEGPSLTRRCALSIASLLAGAVAEVVAFVDYQAPLTTPLWVFGVYFLIAGCVGLLGWRRRREEANV